MEKILNIAIDGPSGSGKSTIAKALSKKLNILYLDTGAMYRAVGLKATRLGIDTFDEKGVKSFIDTINLEIKYINNSQATYLDNEDVSETIREPEVSMWASNISSLKCVRLKMVEMQRAIAKNNSCILDGRDIGSFVLKDAKYKFYLTADPIVRTNRRYKELKIKGYEVNKEDLLKEINQRDYNDKNREFSPLKQAEDAVVIDTSDMNIEEVLKKILFIIESK